MLYELTTLSCPLLAPGQVCERAQAWAAEAEAGRCSAAGGRRSAPWGR